jgi:hypothetical protein
MSVTNSGGWRPVLMSALGLGRTKTPTFNLCVEIPSRFRKFENQKCLRPLVDIGLSLNDRYLRPPPGPYSVLI